MTLKELLTQCSYRIDEVIDTTLTDEDTLLTINKLKSSINTCYEKIAREKLLFLTKETVTLENDIFNTEYLTNRCLKIKRIMDSNGNILRFENLGDNEYKIATDVTDVTVYYYYIPKPLASYADSPKFPKNVDEKILVYYASYEYLNMVGEKNAFVKAQNELNSYQDAYDNIIVPAEIVRVGGYID